MSVIAIALPFRIFGWLVFMIPAAIAIGLGMEIAGTPWYLQVVVWPLLFIKNNEYYLGGRLVGYDQKAILTPIGAYLLRITWVLVAAIIFFKYL